MDEDHLYEWHNANSCFTQPRKHRILISLWSEEILSQSTLKEKYTPFQITPWRSRFKKVLNILNCSNGKE